LLPGFRDKTLFVRREAMSPLSPDLTERLEALFELYQALKGDTDYWWRKERDEPSEIHRRAAVRSTFALIEGVTFALKQFAAGWLRDSEGSLPWRVLASEEIARMALLREESYDLDDKGRVVVRSARLDLPRNLRFALDSFFRIVNKSESPLDASGKEWSAFRTAIRIRNNLMHPKEAGDVGVSSEDALLVNQAYVWFHRLFCTAFGREQ
jgi:hypothetical protein